MLSKLSIQNPEYAVPFVISRCTTRWSHEPLPGEDPDSITLAQRWLPLPLGLFEQLVIDVNPNSEFIECSSDTWEIYTVTILSSGFEKSNETKAKLYWTDKASYSVLSYIYGCIFSVFAMWCICSEGKWQQNCDQKIICRLQCLSALGLGEPVKSMTLPLCVTNNNGVHVLREEFSVLKVYTDQFTCKKKKWSNKHCHSDCCFLCP